MKSKILIAFFIFLLQGCELSNNSIGSDKLIEIIKNDYKTKQIDFKEVVKSPRDLSGMCRAKKLNYHFAIVVTDMQNNFQYIAVCYKEKDKKDYILL